MKKSEKLKEITNSRIYKLTAINYKRECPICGPHSGCNADSSQDERSWKKFRKTQYKTK